MTVTVTAGGVDWKVDEQAVKLVIGTSFKLRAALQWQRHCHSALAGFSAGLWLFLLSLRLGHGTLVIAFFKFLSWC